MHNMSGFGVEVVTERTRQVAHECILGVAGMQKKLEEAQAFMETVNNSKMGRDWRKKTAASEPGQINRFMGEGMMIGAAPAP